MRDPYKILGLARQASAADIKKAYRSLVKEVHPDRHPGDARAEARFREATTAYDLLIDPDKRGRFDRGEIDADGRETFASTLNRAAHAHQSDAARKKRSFFDDMFKRTMPKTRGADVAYQLAISPDEAQQGCRRRVTLSSGSSVDVAVPAGTADGAVLRLRGKGLSGFGGGDPGDALVTISYTVPDVLERQGNDVHMELEVDLQQVVAGDSVQVPTLDGPVTLRIPPGSNGGQRLRLKERGPMNQVTGKRGDQYVTLKLVLEDPADPHLASFVAGWKNDRRARAKSG